MGGGDPVHKICDINQNRFYDSSQPIHKVFERESLLRCHHYSKNKQNLYLNNVLKSVTLPLSFRRVTPSSYFETPSINERKIFSSGFFQFLTKRSVTTQTYTKNFDSDGRVTILPLIGLLELCPSYRLSLIFLGLRIFPVTRRLNQSVSQQGREQKDQSLYFQKGMTN